LGARPRRRPIGSQRVSMVPERGMDITCSYDMSVYWSRGPSATGSKVASYAARYYRSVSFQIFLLPNPWHHSCVGSLRYRKVRRGTSTSIKRSGSNIQVVQELSKAGRLNDDVWLKSPRDTITRCLGNVVHVMASCKPHTKRCRP